MPEAAARPLARGVSGPQLATEGRYQAVGQRGKWASPTSGGPLLAVNPYPAFRLSPAYKLGKCPASGIIKWRPAVSMVQRPGGCG